MYSGLTCSRCGATFASENLDDLCPECSKARKPMLKRIEDEEIAKIAEEWGDDEGLLAQCFPEVFDGSLEWGEYHREKEKYGEIVKEIIVEAASELLEAQAIRTRAQCELEKEKLWDEAHALGFRDGVIEERKVMEKEIGEIFEEIESYFVTKNHIDIADKKIKPFRHMRIADYKWQALKKKVGCDGEGVLCRVRARIKALSC